MQTFKQAPISDDEAILNADSINALRWTIKLRSRRGQPATASGIALAVAEEHVEAAEA